MTPEEIITWVLVLIGLTLSALGVRATFYFGTHREALVDTGAEWVVGSIHTVCATITFVAMSLTLITALRLAWGPSAAYGLITTLLSIWLLTIPYLLTRLFKAKEGVS